MTNLTKILLSYKISIQQIVDILSSFLPIALAFLIVFILFLVLYHALRLYFLYKSSKEPQSLLELQPLRVTEQNPYTTEQLFSVIHGLAKQQTLLYRFFNIAKNYAFEIVSTKEDGIKYLVRVDSDDAEMLKKTLLSYLPGLSVSKVSDYLDSSKKSSFLNNIELTLSKHFAFPLKKQAALDKHDPIAYLTGNMTKLSNNELISFQLVLSPLKKSKKPEIRYISRLIYSGKDLSSNINSLLNKPFIQPFSWVFKPLFYLLMLPIGLMVFVVSGGNEGPFLNTGKSLKEKTSNPYQEELEKLIKNKLDQPLFSASIRLLLIGDNYQEIKRRERGFISALSSFSNAEYQSIRLAKYPRLKIFSDFNYLLFKNRFLGPLGISILSTSEMSDLFHFPYTKTTKTEDLLKQHSKELPAPLSLKKTDSLDVIFAENNYGGTTTPIGLTKDERRRHVYILGATGTGKSTMLLSMVKQDLDNNKGLCLIDPHGDLIDQVLSIIPDKRLEDVVYFNPDDIGYPMGINLLELTPNLTPNEAIREKEFIAESIISIFHKIYTDKYSGPRMEYILRNTIHTAFTVPDATLFTVYKLLINTSFRKSVIRNLTDENLRDFWKYEFAKAGDYQKVKMISPITNKIGRFLFSPTAKRILEQPKSTVSFDEILNNGKILLCNLSKGKIGEDNSSVFGVLIMAKIQLASLKRARMPQDQRKDFYLYVDEFQNFATPAFAQILSEARKYRLNAILAHQTTSQLEETSLVNVTLANTGTVICFRTANPEDERMILPQFRPYVDSGEISSLPSYHFYMRLGALNPEEPFSGVTVPVNIIDNYNKVNDVIESSRNLYAKKYIQLTPKKIVVENKRRSPIDTNRTNSLLP
ncbi:MAG: AAA-like domain protein [Parcubacteria group bacterium ADurb.Bin305]|nr:MAG: AAA-like domain protein [Parcubacteria group bacterium ADurb.Bin305]